MPIEIIECEQGKPEWLAARSGIVTASMFSAVLAKGRGGNGPSLTRRKYMLTLIGERLTGEIQEGHSNGHMERGHAMEDQARALYEIQQGAEVSQVGFIRNGKVGGSPDGLVGDNGLLEIKTKLPHLQLDVLLKDEMPTEHKAQVQGLIWVTEREWCDFVSFFDGLPMFVKRIYRDDKYILDLKMEVARFQDEMEKLEAQIRAMY